uniref:Capsid protein n=1 Tax=Cressdnaviricota sp. TaxID=2748378 RepID=A0A7G8LJ15_9VIRU|nr:capsid protein [Cressdnaviricota sp.]
MNHGFKSRSKSAASAYRRRGGSYGSFAKKFGTYKKVARRPKLVKFATVGYTRDVETKYSDKAIQANAGPMVQAAEATGWHGTSDTWRSINFGGATTTPITNYQQDLLKGVIQGNTATTRVGNKIHVKALKVKMTFVAATVTNATTGFENAQYGEAGLDAVVGELRQYLRTTYRVMVVKDMQVNSEANEIKYSDVMEAQPATGFAGVHSELKVANMGRFRVMTDRLVELDANDPMKTLALNYYNVGNVRYNGTESTAASPALTDNGIYIVWAVWTQGTSGVAPAGLSVNVGPVNVSRRLCFKDA